MNPETMASLIKGAQQVYPDSLVLQKLVVTQGIWESHMNSPKGASRLAVECNNLFGIKARLDKDGKPIEPAKSYKTWEHLNGEDKKVDAWFRKFDSWSECFEWHKKLMNKPRYRSVIISKTIDDACMNIWKAGYATDPQYPRKLMQIYTTIVSKYFKG